MYEEMITKQELIDAQVDAKTLEDVINGPSGELINTRLGRQVYTLASIPIINAVNRDEINGLIDPKADKVQVAADLSLKADKSTTYTKVETDSLVAPKANQADVDIAISGMNSTLNTSLSNLSTTANKYYSTLADANADIANIALNQSVTIGEEANSGLWEKKIEGATSLTKSPYDPLTQAKAYTDSSNIELRTDLSDFLPQATPDFGYLNITTAGEIDFIKKLYVNSTPNWTAGTLYLDYLKKEGAGFAIWFRNSSNVVVLGGGVVETDFTGIKTYTIQTYGSTGYVGKIQIDWSKYNPVGGGIAANRYVKEIARVDFTSTITPYQTKQADQDDLIAAKGTDISILKQNLASYLPTITTDYGYVNITTGGEVDFVKKLYISGTWTASSVFLEYLKKESVSTFAIFFRNASNTVLLGGSIAETDFTGVKTYTVPNTSGNGWVGKIQIDWSKYNPLAGGITYNRYVKEAARVDFTVTTSNDVVHEALQDTRLTSIESKAKALTYKRYVNQKITATDFATYGTVWTLSNGTATCVNPSETTKLFTKQEYISNKIQHRWTVQLKADSVVKFGGYVGAAYIETTCVIDCVGKKLIINKSGDNSSAATTPRTSIAIPFNIVNDRDYYVVLFRNNRKNSIQLIDTITGQSVTATDDWSTSGYVAGSGNMRSQQYVTLASGTSLVVKAYENYLPVNVDVVFGGDSNTESDIDVGGIYQVNWADNLLTEVFNENGVKFAEFGIAFAAWFGCIGEVLAMKPKYFVVNIGTNSATTQAQYQQIVDVCATNNIELILCHNPRDDGSRSYLAQNNLNIDAVNVQTVKFDVATSLNFDLAQPYNSALYKDGVHFNTTGYRVLSDRVLSDVPLLKSS